MMRSDYIITEGTPTAYGGRTVLLLSPIRHWTAQDDDTLCDMISDGCTFADVAWHLRRTRGACIGRFHRIKKAMGVA